MKKFQFRLEKVLRYRRIVKDELMRELLEANAVVRETELMIEELVAEALKPRVAEGQVLSVAELVTVEHYQARLEAEIKNRREQLQLLREKAAEVLGRYMEAAKDEKALSMLKDKKRAAYMQQVEKEIQGMLDEVATQRAPHAARKDQ